MDGRCETCKWWTPYWTDEPKGWGQCDLTRMTGEIAPSDGHNVPIHRETKARANGEAWYSAELLTAPDFGCVQHEPHPERNALDGS